MNRTLVRRAALPITGGIVALILAACGGDGTAMDHGSAASPTAASSSGGASAAFNDSDVSFAQNMIAHHEQAVKMATLAETRAANAELKTLAATIKGAQQPEITMMTGWLTTWGKPVTPAGGHGGHSMPGMMSDEAMTKLEAAKGAEFDRQFATMMIDHHNGAIEMAREVKAKGSSPEIKKLAAQIEQSQAAEVQVLQKLRG